MIRLINILLVISNTLFYSCSSNDDLDLSVSNEPERISEYSIGLRQANLNESKNTIEIQWEVYEADDFESYTIIFNENNTLIEESTTSSYTISDVTSGTNSPLELHVNTSSEITTAVSSISVSTNHINMIIWEEIDDYSTNIGLNWIPSDDDDISDLQIFRSEYDSAIPLYEYDALGTLTDDNWIWESIFDGLNNNYSRRTDTKETFDSQYCYIIKLIDDDNNFRFSLIATHTTTNLVNLAYENNSEITLSATNTLDEIIQLSWAQYIGNDFYLYQIWRSDEEDVETSNNKIKLTEIYDSSTISYIDKYNIENKTWYYIIKVYNQYGRSDKVSDSASGKSIL